MLFLRILQEAEMWPLVARPEIISPHEVIILQSVTEQTLHPLLDLISSISETLSMVVDLYEQELVTSVSELLLQTTSSKYKEISMLSVLFVPMV